MIPNNPKAHLGGVFEAKAICYNVLMKISGMRDTIGWYDQNAYAYAESSKDYVSSDEREQFGRLLTKEAKMLDLGCGAGHDSGWFSENGFDTTGVDLSSGLLDIAKKQAPSATFIHSDIRQLPFEKDYFDGIWARASLVHLETLQDTQSAINEMYRVAKQGGIVYIFVKAQTGEDKTAVVTDKLSGHERFFQYYSVNEISGLLTQAGFEINTLEQFVETEVNPNGRPEVEWIRIYARKV